MLNETEKTMKQYLKGIKLLLPIYGKEERKFLKDYQSAMESFLAEHPVCTPEEFTAHFESPEDACHNYISSLEQESLCKRISFRKLIIKVIICVLSIAVICWIVMLWNISAYEKALTVTESVTVIE